ncbi:molybdopterin/thiamine biosynthesis adenylyltransferase [Saccharopolyspora lacisalsi]|uniref:Molybdopterin/thiamine biosynthesis adenylyltransferase n=1 Tax=Halosaccharopolyspora lacisalsi TaxID=1000566 RepID=A0A839E5K9_9PSEU|nr:ThiF family adenylyltransferase [Halosaccharopolyspora lacisalsi]MBA8826611.1 molybdopterin/thiamine biosynthesis adenylyltransferase [Halosaccharopolyspora lacisalsi]
MGTLTAEDFYQEFTRRNQGIVTERTQEALGRSRVLIAGCGSTGGAAVEPLVRIGVQKFSLADNGEFELNNLNRQHARYSDLQRNKADVAAQRAQEINPHADVLVEPSGINAENVARLTDGAELVIDGVDVTDMRGWHAKLMLHQTAAAAGKPVLSGYDMAGVQYVRYYDYRSGGTAPLQGKIRGSDLKKSDPWRLLIRVIPIRTIPLEMIESVRPNLGNPDYHVPQLVYTSQLFGALISHMSAEILSGRKPRPEVVIDLHDIVRRRPARARVAGRRALELARAGADILRLFSGASAEKTPTIAR